MFAIKWNEIMHKSNNLKLIWDYRFGGFRLVWLSLKLRQEINQSSLQVRMGFEPLSREH